MKILFIARTYPPVVGGLERFAGDFYSTYQNVGDIDLLANPVGKKATIPFLLKTAFNLAQNSRKYDVIHMSDAALSVLIPLIRRLSSAKISLTVHGLDVIYPHFGYQRVIPFLLKEADKIISVSHFTMRQCVVRGIPKEKITVIPNGINLGKIKPCSTIEWMNIRAKYNIPDKGKKIMLTVGRLIKRKGHSWFIDAVIPKLPQDYIYIIAGSGPEQNNLSALIRDLGLETRVYILGEVTEEEKSCLYQVSDLFIMPNISTIHDQEGFGIVILEAGIHGLPAIASNIEGISDAVIPGQTGHLINERDVGGFIEAITNPEIDPSTIPAVVSLKFDWSNISKSYNAEFRKMLEG